MDVYNPNGTFVKRFASAGSLNAPWGIAKAPDSFWSDGGLSGAILVGNFGDGKINVFRSDGSLVGTLQSGGNTIVIDGLWGISFGFGTGVNTNYLYFAAGPNDEQDGLTGYIKK